MSSKAVETIAGIDYRFLESDDWQEWKLIDAEFKKRGVDPPSRLSKVAFAEDADGNISFYMVQTVLHAEPLVLHPAHKTLKGTVLMNLIAMIKAWIQSVTSRGKLVYIVAETAEAAELCEFMDLERVQCPVYRTKVTGR